MVKSEPKVMNQTERWWKSELKVMNRTEGENVDDKMEGEDGDDEMEVKMVMW